MKILVATNDTQGQRDHDFCHAVEGELVVFPPIECDGEPIDGECGCHRAMAGLASHKATTTVKVSDQQDLTYDVYRGLITDGLKHQGYVTEELMKKPDVQEWLHDLVADLLGSAAIFKSGTVLERRGDYLFVRREPSRETSTESRAPGFD
ncbi:MAG: hypothetical protein M3277_01140 [Actinomycetota bacterium]|nr:hypothetical protein [Actinomycetota bacterium]